jgi:hypothetical protein
MKMKKSKKKDVKPYAEKAAKKKGTVISNNTFTGVHWDAEATESVYFVAKGLFNLSELFRCQNIKIDSMLKIGTEKNQ